MLPLDLLERSSHEEKSRAAIEHFGNVSLSKTGSWTAFNSKIITNDIKYWIPLTLLVDDIFTRLPQIDILINNGGRSQRSLCIDTSMDVYQALMELNFLGTVSITKQVLSHMTQQRAGSIVTVSSVAGLSGVPLGTGYSATKHALQVKGKLYLVDCPLSSHREGCRRSYFLSWFVFIHRVSLILFELSWLTFQTYILSQFVRGLWYQRLSIMLSQGKWTRWCPLIVCDTVDCELKILFSHPASLGLFHSSVHICPPLPKPLATPGSQEHKMPTSRCVRLMLVGIANNIKEMWIAEQPFLLFHYLWQYTPTVAWCVTNILGRKRVQNFKSGLVSLKKTWYFISGIWHGLLMHYQENDL